MQERVPLITQSSSVTEPTHMPVARQVQMAALLIWQEHRPRNLNILCNFAVLMGTYE